MQSLMSYRVILAAAFAVIFVLALAASFKMTSPLGAQEKGKAQKIGVIDMQRILNESQAAKNIQKQIKAQRSQLEQEFGNLEQELKQQKQSLIQEQKKLGQEAFQKKQAQFRQKLQKSRSKAQTERQKLKQAISDATDILRQNVKEVGTKLGQAGNYDLVISRQSAIYAADKHDITDTILARLNDKITEINLAYSAK